jgi:hypothetical protein
MPAILQVAPPSPRGSPPIPTWSRSSLVTCTNGRSTASAVHRRPHPRRPILSGPASGGGKQEGIPDRVPAVSAVLDCEVGRLVFLAAGQRLVARLPGPIMLWQVPHGNPLCTLNKMPFGAAGALAPSERLRQRTGFGGELDGGVASHPRSVALSFFAGLGSARRGGRSGAVAGAGHSCQVIGDGLWRCRRHQQPWGQEQDDAVEQASGAEESGWDVEAGLGRRDRWRYRRPQRRPVAAAGRL